MSVRSGQIVYRDEADPVAPLKGAAIIEQQIAVIQTLHEPSLERDETMPPTPPRFVIDCSTYRVNNNGDIAMFSVLLRRLWARYPDAHISMITNDPEGVQGLDSRIEPIVVGDRRLWSLETLVAEPLPARESVLLRRAERLVRLAAPRRYWAHIALCDRAAARAGLKWQAQLQRADAVFLTGGGYFTDVFAEHAVHLLSTLQEGMMHGAATFIVGCGFEHVTQPLLRSAAEEILPYVDFIGCREDLVSPSILLDYGVDATNFAVTGDDALELAFEARSDLPGDSIGINLRNASYNRVEDSQIAEIRCAVTSAAKSLGASLRPLPISNYEPSDWHEISKLTQDTDCPISGRVSLNRPQKLFEQLRMCRIVITGSYHAAVFGLAMGIPVIALTNSTHYESKMAGLMHLFSNGDTSEGFVFVIDDPDLSAKLARAIPQVWARAEERRPYLLQAAESQVHAGHMAYQKIFDRIDAHRFHPANGHPVQTLAPDLARPLISLVAQLNASAAQAKAQRDFFEYHATKRLEIINDLKQHLDASEADRQARQVVIDDLLRRLKASEAERSTPQWLTDQLKQAIDAGGKGRTAQNKGIEGLFRRMNSLIRQLRNRQSRRQP